MSSRSLRAMPELGKIIERTENDDEQRHHADERRVMTREWLLDKYESGDQQGDGRARCGDSQFAFLEIIKIEANRAADGEEVAGDDEREVGS